MMRRLWLALPLVAVSGCFDFDAAFAEFCDGGRCASSGGGAASVGGGTNGGGAATGGGSTMGGGSATGGGSSSGGGSTTGGGAATGGGNTTCQSDLCPEIDWMSSLSSIHYEVAPGLYAPSYGTFFVYAAFERNAAGSHNFTHWEFRFLDGGTTPTTISRSSGFPDNVETRQLKGTATNDLWYVYRLSVQRREGNFTPDYLTACEGLDGGMTDPWHYAVDLISPDEAWLVGQSTGPSICHYTRSGMTSRLVETADPSPYPYVTLLDVYRAPSGEVYAVGGDYDSNVGQSTCKIFREDGSLVGAPVIHDTWYDDGCASIDGTGNDVYVLARSNDQQRGEILKLQPDGGFASAYVAPFRLARLDVTPAGEVWAIGSTGAAVVHFDGTMWSELTLPLTENRADVFFENVSGHSDGIILTGFEVQLDGGRTAIVNTYRTRGH